MLWQARTDQQVGWTWVDIIYRTGLPGSHICHVPLGALQVGISNRDNRAEERGHLEVYVYGTTNENAQGRWSGQAQEDSLIPTS